MKKGLLKSKKQRLFLVFSLISMVSGFGLFVSGIILAWIFEGDLYYLMAFAGLPLMWLGSFLWRAARKIPFQEDLPTQSGSVTCTCVEVPREDKTKGSK